MLFELAESIYDVSGVPPGWEAGLPAKFNDYSIQSVPPETPVNRFTISIEGREHLVPSGEVIDLNELTEFFPEERGVRYVSLWCEGFFGLDGENVELDLVCHPEGKEHIGNIIENALRVMVAYDVMNRGGFMLHSASIVMQEGAIILVGHSGAGKSTCSQFAVDAGHYVISDDINVVLPGTNDEWQVVTVPFNGTAEILPVKLPSEKKVRLKSLYRLQQSSKTGSIPVSKASAVAKLYASMPFVNADIYRSDQVIERLTGLVSTVPFRQLEFCRTPGFLTELEKAS